MGIELAVDHFLRGGDDGSANGRVEAAEGDIGFGRSALNDAERPDDRQRLLLPADLEVLEAALRLGPSIAVLGHFDRPECVRFNALRCHGPIRPILAG